VLESPPGNVAMQQILIPTDSLRDTEHRLDFALLEGSLVGEIQETWTTQEELKGAIGAGDFVKAINIAGELDNYSTIPLDTLRRGASQAYYGYQYFSALCIAALMPFDEFERWIENHPVSDFRASDIANLGSREELQDLLCAELIDRVYTLTEPLVSHKHVAQECQADPTHRATEWVCSHGKFRINLKLELELDDQQYRKIQEAVNQDYYVVEGYFEPTATYSQGSLSFNMMFRVVGPSHVAHQNDQALLKDCVALAVHHEVEHLVQTLNRLRLEKMGWEESIPPSIPKAFSPTGGTHSRLAAKLGYLLHPDEIGAHLAELRYGVQRQGKVVDQAISDLLEVSVNLDRMKRRWSETEARWCSEIVGNVYRRLLSLS